MTIKKRNISFFILLSLFTILTGCGIGSYTDLSGGIVASSPADEPGAGLESIRFFDHYFEAASEAQRQGKPMLLFFSLSDNVSSARIFSKTFANSEITRLAKHFVCVSIDGENESQLCQTFNVKGFPTILITTPQGAVLQHLSGKEVADQLPLQMHVVIQTTAAQLSSAVRK